MKIKIDILLATFFLVITSNSFGQLYKEEILLNNCYGQEASFGDLDRDGDLDLLLSYNIGGIYGERHTTLFKNQEGNFVPLDIVLPSLTGGIGGSSSWLDINNDGYLDLFLMVPNYSKVTPKLFINNKDNTFIEEDINLGIYESLNTSDKGPSWADFDNDGDLDMLVMLDFDYNGRKLRIFENTNEGFIQLGNDNYFGTKIIKSRLPWADFNSDGYLDFFVLNPTSDSQCTLGVYKNNGDKSFTYLDYPNIPALNHDVLNYTGDMRWGDFDGNGYPDILMSGQHTNSNGVGITYLYKNNGDETFSAVNVDNMVDPNYGVSLEWGDYDSDGDLDILHTGETWENGIIDKTRVYLNESGVFFDANIEHLLRSHSHGMSTAGDFTNDNKLDLVVLGGLSFEPERISLYRDTSETTNTPPSIPVGLDANYENNELVFSWSQASDLESSQTLLTYNISVTKDNEIIVNSFSLPNGKRMVVRHGNSMQNTFYKMRFPKSGTYKWSVQAIDASFVGGSFAEEKSFTIASFLNTSSASLTIAATENSTQTFDVSSNIDWTVSSDESWLTISDESGSGNAIITLTAEANPTTTTRSATITVSGSGVANKTITVTQDAGATGIIDINGNLVSLFPNPVESKLIIENIRSNSIINIYELNGKMLITRTAKFTCEEMDVSIFPRGIYIIKISNEKEITISKFIKQ